jgi:hypothetical protein
MAQLLGLKRSWFQVSRSGMPHYDICQSKREQAIRLGAVEIDRRKMVELMKTHREAGRSMSKREAQGRLDDIDSEVSELYRQVREKEAERDRYDRIANPDDYTGANQL